MDAIARVLIITGGVIVAIGVVLFVLGRAGIPLGRLPGDIHFVWRGAHIDIPIVTSIILSLLLTLIANLFFRR